ncbi:MAG: hypothetical protein K6T94_22420 [Paenibacillus sp.]|nr:hypothetical protein [Paenibacillus sp.]
MFGGSFNRLTFDRPYAPEVLLSIEFEFKTEMQTPLNLEMSMPAAFEFLTEYVSPLTRELTFLAQFEFMTEFNPVMVREINMYALFEFMTEFENVVKYTHTDEITFTGNFAPGERIVIDAKKMRITKNGQNILHLVEGDPFDLVFGVNKIRYEDPETTRSVLTRITHRDKYLY